MKKKYIKPESDNLRLETQTMLALSGVSGGGDGGINIGGGGTDTDGSIEPCSYWQEPVCDPE